MDAQRRSAVATAGSAVLGELERAVVDSWTDLMPVSRRWSPASLGRAVAASKAVLRGLLVAFSQGDIDDRSRLQVRDVLLGHGHASPDEAAELLRTVRIVGVEALADRLVELIGLTHDERWQLQREASAFCEQLLGISEDIDPDAVDMMLAELERTGPDLA
jgi:hypothetical protein